ncbi:MAG: beta-galactosidase trimerization domain-containing protein [Candidatus Bathyarchaeota archaeon]|nr:beta-galactosidase trimerization domain-containing protein [Candidatus Bathyarchaeota archaeon]
MSRIELSFRQVHLDFHTSEHIVNVGADLDPEEFASTLKKAHVNSVTCFARCHHGWIYFDTKLFPERRHPHLTRNLLKEQIEACHKKNIRVPIYTTVQWDHYTANEHPEWLVLDEHGYPTGTKLYEPGFYRNLCVNSPYRDFLKAHVKEILQTFPVDGLFLDIVRPLDCSCKYCRAGMEAEGLEPSDPQVRWKYAVKTINNFKMEMTDFIRQFNEDCTIFYNSGHVGPMQRSTVSAYTHFEIESLPSGGWGYMHFPIAVRYARNLGVDCLGMTGKFHTSWGDFHSFKNKRALEFECFRMLALAAKCSIGDQLHPSGRICPVTYNLIREVYSQVEEKEPWCKGARPVSEIGVLTPEEFMEGASFTQLPPAIIGVTRMLQEGFHQFEIIDSASDFSRFKVLILPDNIPVSPDLAHKLEKFIADGGSIIASYESGLNSDKTGFALKELGVKLKGPAPYSPDFIVPRGEIGRGLPETEHVMYMRGLEVEPEAGSQVLADVVIPYFNRTYRHFCSHRHTPSSGKVGYPGIIRSGRAIYFIHPIFSQYHKNAPLWCKKLFLNALDMLLPEPLIRAEAPSTALITLNEQTAENRWVLHLLHYIPERRGQDFDIIEDLIPIFNVRVSVRVPKKVEKVMLVPEEAPLDFKVKDNRVEFTIPKVEGHQMVALNFT